MVPVKVNAIEIARSSVYLIFVGGFLWLFGKPWLDAVYALYDDLAAERGKSEIVASSLITIAVLLGLVATYFYARFRYRQKTEEIVRGRER